MNLYPFVLPVQTTLAIAGSDEVFPVARVLCIGRNYAWPDQSASGKKDGSEAIQMPSWFMKPAQAVVPARGLLPYPPNTQDFCHEIELVIALGKGGYQLSAQEAERECIWGYAAGLDMTRRELQQQAKRDGGPWSPSKVFESSAPCSPIVPVAQLGHPRAGAIWAKVNGDTRQSADIGQMLFAAPELVAMLSKSLCLLPGDLIFTGTPAGVGPVFPGDHIEAGIDGIANIKMQVSEAASV